ncbi:hypothetical protein [Ensifer aridi]|uniref:hypothetical protein n=1 Tax=Ensifer aridi TaxID=1708715 RepID=UPI0009BD245D|nr:hypothetical protein [Ensifer aridi]
MSGETVGDISVGKTDLTGLEIVTVYSKIPKVYAVYANSERVMIQYADGEQLAMEQKLALAHLAPLRGEINGLIDGWRSSKHASLDKAQRKRHPNIAAADARAKRYDRRTADALVVALQGDQASAEMLLGAIKHEILEERTSTGRVQYVLTAGFLTVAIFLVFWLLHSLDFPKFVAQNDIWMATGLGCLGAFFSIAIGIRGRTIQTDLRLRDNLVDGGLRIVIGAISAVVLFAIFRSHIFELSFGQASPITLCVSGPNCSPPNIDIAIVVAFLAGFSERLVGDLLDSKFVPVIADPATAPASQSRSRRDTSRATASRSQADATNPAGRTQPANGTAAPQAPPTDPNDHLDYCLCDTELEGDETTDDLDLPKASGGIEKPLVH